MVAGGVHGDSGVNGLEEAAGVDAGDEEAGLVQGLGAFRRCADAHRRERMAHRREERTFLRQGAGVAHYREGVHLQTVIVVEAQGLVADDARVQLEAGGFEALPRARVAGVEDRHVVLLRHRIDRVEQRQEILLRIDVLFPVRTEKDILALLQAQSRVHVGRLDVGEVLVENLRHRAPRHVRALLRQPAVGQIPPRMLGVRQIDIRNDIDNPPVRLLRQALILAPVAGLHVENGDMQPLRADDAEARVRVTQHQHRIGLDGDHQLVALRDDIAHGLPQIRPHGIHIHLRRRELQVLEEHAVKVVIVILSRMRQNRVEIRPTLIDDCGQPDDFRTRPHDNEEF